MLVMCLLPSLLCDAGAGSLQTALPGIPCWVSSHLPLTVEGHHGSTAATFSTPCIICECPQYRGLSHSHVVSVYLTSQRWPCRAHSSTSCFPVTFPFPFCSLCSGGGDCFLRLQHAWISQHFLFAFISIQQVQSIPCIRRLLFEIPSKASDLQTELQLICCLKMFAFSFLQLSVLSIHRHIK